MTGRVQPPDDPDELCPHGFFAEGCGDCQDGQPEPAPAESCASCDSPVAPGEGELHVGKSLDGGKTWPVTVIHKEGLCGGARGDSPHAAWQRGMMEFDPSTCWCFVAPDRVCVRQRPCPLHETRANTCSTAPITGGSSVEPDAATAPSDPSEAADDSS